VNSHYSKERRTARLAGKLVPRRLLMKLRRAFLTWEVASNRARREPAMEGLRFLIQEGDCIADLGANIGVYALELSRLAGAAGRVYSFEPILENFKILEGVTRTRRLSNVRLHRAAIGATTGRCEMVIPKVQGFSGLYTAHLIRAGDEGEIEVVDVFALDDLVQKNEMARVDFIRADVAGAELEVIGGSRNLLSTQRPGLLLGVSRRNGDQVFAALKDYGYRAFLYTGRFEEAPEPPSPKSYLHFFLHLESKCWRLAEAAGVLAILRARTQV
jgi:FkbM family methyltransferase